MTECTQQRLDLGRWSGRDAVGEFEGEEQSSDGGLVLLREADGRLRLLDRLEACFQDWRDPALVRHGLREMLAQRVLGLALGYEDLNDHEELRRDRLLQLAAGKPGAEMLAGKSTLNRLELSLAEPGRYKRIAYAAEKLDELLLQLFAETQASPPEELVLDLDATDVPVHGHQEARFFHGFYGHYCYLPLYIVCGSQVLAARLRPADQDPGAGALPELERVVAGLRARWPRVRIVVRGDSGFCREAMMAWCEREQVDYALGLARNARLSGRIEAPLARAAERHQATRRPEREFSEFPYSTLDSWSRERRVVAKAEQIEGKANPRFVVTSLPAGAWPPQALYETLYCARGEMENRIKEQMMLFADRLSAGTMRANQLRLYLSTFAYLLVDGVRRLGLAATEMARAQPQTIRLRLLKISTRVRVTARRIWLTFPRACPHQAVFRQCWAALRC